MTRICAMPPKKPQPTSNRSWSALAASSRTGWLPNQGGHQREVKDDGAGFFNAVEKTDLNVGGGGAERGQQGERDAESHPDCSWPPANREPRAVKLAESINRMPETDNHPSQRENAPALSAARPP